MPINLGVASGAIEISTVGVTGAERTVKSAAANMTRDLSGVGKGAAAAEGGFKRVFDMVSKFGGAVGIGIGGAAAAQQAAKLVLDSIEAASDLTESMNKVDVAFADSSDEILKWSKGSARSLGQSRQQALEAASSFGLLFTTMGLAPTESAEMSKSLVQLAADMASINNISPEEALIKLRAGLVGEVEPLRTVGVLLNAATVEAKALAMGLAPTTRALTEQDKVMARYQLILEQTALTQGDFARTSGEAANQQRILAANLKDTEAVVGKLLIPLATMSLGATNSWLEGQIAMAETYADALDKALAALVALVRFGGTGSFSVPTPTFDVGTQGINRSNRHAPIAPPRWGENQKEVEGLIVDWSEGMADIEKNANEDRLENIRDFNENVAQTERDYHLSSSREAQDFAISRARAEADQLDNLADIRREAGRREVDMAEDLARANTQAAADSGERIADARKDAGERLIEIDRDYAKARERGERDHRDTILDAAGRLDAKAVRDEQIRFARESQDAKEAHDEQRADLTEALDERITAEQEALAKSNAQRQEAYNRQLEDGRENDAQRTADLIADFEARKALEDEDRALRLERAAADYQANLDEMARQHALDLEQIATNKAEERTKLQEEFDAAMVAAGVQNAEWQKMDDARTAAAIANWDRVGAAALSASQAALAGGAAGPLRPGQLPYTPLAPWTPPSTSGGNKSIVVSEGAVQISVPPGMNEAWVSELVLTGIRIFFTSMVGDAP